MKVFIAVFIILVLGAGVWYFVNMNASPEPADSNLGASSTPTPSPTPTPSESAQGGNKTVKVEMTASGFSPKELTINVGDTVQFLNKDSREWWPASGMHPTHQICPGFDALKRMAPGESYSHTFTKAGECPMHDHTKPSFFGKIIVK